ncbi:aspartate-semialdehyde dehydrogenase [Thermoplasma sp. Kam2015]|uniref:aspartate-semialdehyde dehydrogenase n=1 Tax=Thermoplasma sp. Kam2015 TaxID=2094122 RepID=UPI000D869661|nr:aspartate-semialdehyde dehydrogenase [Thermoplasma sp. Kam2015]PYB68663.1 aspartate-semialdehyde dehydrogenase [Thermoplasma sp. Kam2015]
MDKIKVGLIGSTGIVGSLISKMIVDHPYFELSNVYASDRSANRKYGEAAYGNIPAKYEDILVKESDADLIIKDRNDIIFSAVSDERAGVIERRLAESGIPVFTNASANRMEPDVPIIIPEINGDLINRIRSDGFIIANGNCSTIGLSLGIDPIIHEAIEEIDVTTLQSVSGAGYPGMASIDIIDNVIPYIAKEETKIERETAKIFSGKLNAEIYATATRVPVKIGHLESIHVRFRKDIDAETILEEFKNYRNGSLKTDLPSLPENSVVMVQEDDRPQPAIDGMNGGPGLKAGMSVSIGRIRVKARSLDFVLLVNNIVRGAAGSTLLNAELAHAEGLI